MATRTSIAIQGEQVDRLVEAVFKAISPYGLQMFLEDDVQDYLAEQIELRFAYEGDSASGDWDRLSEATQHIRSQAGFLADGPINVRTGQLLQYLTENYDARFAVGGAEMFIPGNTSGQMEQKIRHAQMGSQPGENPLFPNSSTPARPVLAISEMDLAAVLELLSLHIVDFVVTGPGF